MFSGESYIFQGIEKNVKFVCKLGRENIQIMLESYDKELAKGRDKKIYRDKGTRDTSRKTVYGEATGKKQKSIVSELH